MERKQLTKEQRKKLISLGLLSEQFEPLGYISTGSYALNKVISGKYDGGYPIGSICELIGESSTGKTAMLTTAFAEAQKAGCFTMMVDNEGTYDPGIASKYGVDPKQLIYAGPDKASNILTAFQWVEDTVKALAEIAPDTPILLGFDSLGTIQSSREEEKAIGERSNTDGAIRAGEIGSCFRKLNPLVYANKMCCLFINQFRSDIMASYGDPRIRAGGGKSFEYYCKVTNRIVSNKTTNLIKDKHTKQVTGIEGSIVNTKNKISVPHQECAFRLTYVDGLSPLHGVVPLLEGDGILERNGAWYTVKETQEKFQTSSFEEKLAAGELAPIAKILGINQT